MNAVACNGQRPGTIGFTPTVSAVGNGVCGLLGRLFLGAGARA